MPARALNDIQVKWAFARHCEGYTFQETADALFVNVGTIRDEFKRNGLKKDRSPLSYSPDEEVPKTVSFYKVKNASLNEHQLNWAYHHHWKGQTIRDLSLVLGVSMVTLRNTFKKHNLKTRYRKIIRKRLVYDEYKKEVQR